MANISEPHLSGRVIVERVFHLIDTKEKCPKFRPYIRFH
jgi:hypothetical protein